MSAQNGLSREQSYGFIHHTLSKVLDSVDLDVLLEHLREFFHSLLKVPGIGLSSGYASCNETGEDAQLDILENLLLVALFNEVGHSV